MNCSDILLASSVILYQLQTLIARSWPDAVTKKKPCCVKVWSLYFLHRISSVSSPNHFVHYGTRFSIKHANLYTVIRMMKGRNIVNYHEIFWLCWLIYRNRTSLYTRIISSKNSFKLFTSRYMNRIDLFKKILCSSNQHLYVSENSVLTAVRFVKFLCNLA